MNPLATDLPKQPTVPDEVTELNILLAIYDELRRLDESNVDILIAEMAEETGVGIAVNDRLTRAATGAPTHIHEMNNQTKEK